MSKFCKNCGKVLDDAMRFCDGCGAPQQAAPQQQAPQQPQYQAPQQPQYQAPQQPQYQAPQQPQYRQPPVATPPKAPVAKAPAAPKTNFDFNKIINEGQVLVNGLIKRCKADQKFMYTCIGIAAGALVVLILLITLLSSLFTTYTKPIDTMIDVTFKGKVNKIKNLAPADYWEWYEDEYDMDIDDIIEEAEDEFDDTLDYYEDEYGDNLRVSYKVEKKKALSDKKVKGIAEALADRYDLDEDDFTAAYELDLEMTIKGSEDDDEEDSEMTVIKYKGDWYLITWYKSGSEYSASFMTGY